MSSNKTKFGKVAVLMGGLSSEREISLMSGKAVHAALLQQGIDAHAVDVGHDICQQLIAGQYDRAWIALHGPGGEDGVIQGVLETLQIPYTGSDVAASSLAMDKQRTKWLLQGIGLPTPRFVIADKNISAESVSQHFSLPWAVKPNSQGSTLGITRVNDVADFKKALDLAFTYDQHVIIEPWIIGKELTVGILDQQALPVIHIEAQTNFYDYEAKYFSDETLYHCPSNLSVEIEKKAQQIALQAYQAVGCRHWGRVDLILDQQNQVWVLEVNTIPGMTDHSLVPKAAKQIGINFNELVVKILEKTV
jgi:D-alanine-D-alanine ligase